MKKNDFCILKNGDCGYYDGEDTIITSIGEEYPLSEVQFALRYADNVAAVEEQSGSGDGVVFPVTETGSRGLTVVLLQTALKCRGYYDGKIDGDFGLQTYNSLHRYRDDNGLDGETVADAEVYQLLFADN